VSWDRFHYICRRYTQQTEPDISLFDISKQTSTRLYAGPVSKQHLSLKLLEEIVALEDAKVQSKAAETYAKLDFSSFLNTPLKLRRITSYSTYLSIIFFIVITVFQFQIIPSYLGFFQEYGVKPPRSFVWLSESWALVSMGILIFILLTVYLGVKIKAIFDFTLKTQENWLSKLLLSSKIKQLSSQIYLVINTPLYLAQNIEQTKDSEWYKHLSTYDQSEQLGKEMTVLLQKLGAELSLECEKYLQRLNVLLVITIVISIVTFLQGTYSPIFALGDVLL
jgi:type II secretory pathway component PulF